MLPAPRRRTSAMLGRIALGLLLALAATGCSSRGEGPRAEALVEPPASGLALLRLERTTNHAEPSLPPAIRLDALFARYQGLDPEAVADLLGVGADDPAYAGCRWDGSPMDDSLAEDAVIDLVDVGPIRVELGAEVAVVRGRVFPSVSSVLSGTIYADELPRLASLEGSDEVRVYAAGDDAIGPVEVALVAPGLPASVLVDGHPLEAGMDVERVGNLRLEWEPTDAPDRVEIAIRAGSRRLRCGTPDEGVFEILAPALAQLPADESATLTIARVRREAIAVPGVREAYAQTASKRVVPIALR